MQSRKYISRRAALKLAAATVLAGPTIIPAAMAADQQLVVVELFTSQGCSSCPPADKLLGELAKKPNVVALSLNVDYWDYLGWRDTLGSPENSKRQKMYAKSRGTRQVYTPQMIVNGHIDVIGSQRDKVLSAVKGQTTDNERVHMTMTSDEDEIIINVDASPTPSLAHKATIWLMVTSPEVSVPIKRGENIGKDITYHNVVRQMIPAGMWDGKAIRIVLPKAGLNTGGKRDCVALLQQGNVGKIIGVAGISNLSH